ncbi:MAG: CRISPR-associated endoribonuclease Cas6 [Lachnospiraceae bacterium]|nr:CRISPR-associated endoribonuclease Cas6 [Lachnospiraceae bacterium]
MRLLINHKVQGSLCMPISYHHILQSIIYHKLQSVCGYSEYMHDKGQYNGKRNYKMFTFSGLRGKYRLENKQLIFYDSVSFEISSNDFFMLKLLGEEIAKNGLDYGKNHYSMINIYYFDDTIEDNEIEISMLSPICVYSTDLDKNTHFYGPYDREFQSMINDNFKRKYEACYGVKPTKNVFIEAIDVNDKCKYVTKYKGIYITGWKGKYILKGERKYLDFLYQVGLGSKNSQGFGMFSFVKKDN